jgi:hypothetical protein
MFIQFKLLRFNNAMKKILFFIFLIISILQQGCSKSETIIPNPDEDINVIDPEEDVNLPPVTFYFQIKENVSGTEVVITWSEARDPENELVTYDVYLDEVLMVEGLVEREFEFTDLDELTTYTIKIIAKDPQDNETVKIFDFTTVKYYLRFSKFYDFDDVFSPGGRPYSIIRADDGNYVIAGSSNRPDSNGQQFFVMKIDEEGNEIWKYFYFYQIGDSMFFKIIQLRDQNFIVGAGNDVLKIDNEGILIWHIEIPGFGDGLTQSIKSIKEDLNDNLFVVGSKASTEPNKKHAGAVAKLDGLGNVIWNKEFNPLAWDTFDDLVITDTNTLVILGSNRILDQSIGSIDFWVVHLDNDGNIIWEKTFGDDRDDFPRQIIRTTDGNYAFCGGSSFGLSYDASLFKINSNGEVLFSSLYTPDNFFNYSITETDDGGFAATGFDFNPNTFTLLKYDSSGNVEWNQRYYEFNLNSLGHGILQTNDEGFIAVGVYDDSLIPGGIGPKIWVIKTDPDGYFELESSPF